MSIYTTELAHVSNSQIFRLPRFRRSPRTDAQRPRAGGVVAMDVTNADLFNLGLYGLVFIAWAMGFSKGGQR